MNGKLVIEGDLETLGKVATELNSMFTTGITARVTPDPWEGWTVEAASAVYNAAAHAARTTLEMTVRAGGFVPDGEVRAVLGDRLTGRITGPLNKHINRLAAAGTIPADLPKPLSAGDGGKRGWRPSQGFTMPKPLVPIFASAIGI